MACSNRRVSASRTLSDSGALASAARWLPLGVLLLLGACAEAAEPGLHRPVMAGGKSDHVGATCEGFCGERNFAARCSCTADCSALQDCCPDVA